MNDRNYDYSIIQKMRRGERKAFDLLILKYQRSIHRVVSRHVHDPDDAQDVLEYTFVRAYRNYPNYREDRSFFSELCDFAADEVNKYLVSQGQTGSVHYEQEEIADIIPFKKPS